MVSVMLMPAMVAEASLLRSRIWTRVIFTRFLLICRAISRVRNTVPRPTAVIRGLKRSMKTR